MKTAPSTCRLALLLALASLIGSSAFAQDTARSTQATPSIIPIPQKWTWQKGRTDIRAFDRIVLGTGSTEGDRFAASQLQKVLADRYGLDVPIRSEEKQPSFENAIVLGDPAMSELASRQVTAADLPDGEHAKEGYVLEVGNDRAVVTGRAEVGRFYGAMSLVQLLDAGDGTLRHMRIIDEPTMEFRGVSDDISRGQVSTMANFKKIIRFMGRHKMNFYTPYIEDVLEFEAYPSIGEGRGALSKDEVRALQDYAAKWHVDVVPTFQTLGHYENILNMNKFVKYAEYPGAASLNTQDSTTYAFLETLLDEVAALFKSKYVHIGVDEAWAIGKGASKEAVEEKGVAAVLAEHVRKVQDMLAERGKKVIMYGDMPLRHPKGRPENVQGTFKGIPKDVIFLDWQYAATDYYPSTDIFAKAGRPFIIGPALQNWRRVYPNQAAAWTNIYQGTLAGYRDGALGSVVHSWGDMGGPNFRELNYRGYAYAAECAWNPTGAQERTIDRRFNTLFYGRDADKLHAIEALLTRLSHDVYFSDVWEHPFNTVENFPDPGPRPFPGKAVPVVASFRKLPILAKAKNIQESAGAARALINGLQLELPQNSQHLDYHRWVAWLADWFGERMEYAEWIYNIRRKFAPEKRAPFQKRAVRWGRKLRQQIQKLAGRYEDLWRRTNREANLDRLLTLFDYQQAYLGQIIEALQNNRWTVRSKIRSAFITAPGVSGEKPKSTVYVRKEFQIDGNREIKGATLQLVGDTHVKTWLNGKALGRVIAQGTLSLWVKRQRVKTWEVEEELQPGTNVLAARATSYVQSQPGAANLYLEIRYVDGTTRRVLSSEDWKATGNLPPQEWTQASYDAGGWQPAEAEDRQTVSAPMFERGLPSRTE